VIGSDKPLPAFLLAAGGPLLQKGVSLAVALAIVNALIVGTLINARQLYCSGRDGVWPRGWNAAVAAVHPTFRSPWVATLIMGAASAACCFLDLGLLVMLTATGIVAIYGGVSLAALAGRRNGSTAAAEYRMPLYPLAPIFSLAAVAAVAVVNLIDPAVGQPSLIGNGVVMAAFAGYYLFYLKRRGGWVLRGADGMPLEALEAAE
jgi:amino acid transporter